VIKQTNTKQNTFAAHFAINDDKISVVYVRVNGSP